MKSESNQESKTNDGELIGDKKSIGVQEEIDAEKAKDLYDQARSIHGTYLEYTTGIIKDPYAAIKLYEQAIAAGDEKDATSGLAKLIRDIDSKRAIELYERSIAAGNERNGTHDLATLIQDTDPERAIELYERAIAAGDEKNATCNLAVLICKTDCNRAIELLERSIAAGEEEHATYNLANLIRDTDPKRAAELYERAIAAGSECFATDALAWLIKDADPERANELFGRAHLAGIECYDTDKLATLAKDTDPEWVAVLSCDSDHWSRFLIQRWYRFVNMESVTDLTWERKTKSYEKDINEGDEKHATCNLACLIYKTDRKRAFGAINRCWERTLCPL